jgi:hypothetical protein
LERHFDEVELLIIYIDRMHVWPDPFFDACALRHLLNARL